MLFVLFSILFLVFSAFVSALIKDQFKKALIACFGTTSASAIGLLSVLIPIKYLKNGIQFQTNIPNISFSFGLDSLSCFFLVVILIISFLISIYGFGYIKNQKSLTNSSPFFPLLIASMLGVIVSRDGFSFILIWEIMSLVSFFLVTAEHENKEVQNAGWIYLIATHLATAFLMAFFVVLAKINGSFLFSDFISNPMPISFLAGTLFIFVIIGFGTKAGIFPLHVWLPHAHPAAPSYISAIMSGVMIKTGIYGILRAITFFQTPPVWWGGLLIVIGVASAIMGVLYALMQHDLKRLLAYHSVENIGIIVTGIGVGLIGVSQNNQLIILLGFGGALFHVLNHAIFKSLLFLCAGNLIHATHSLLIDRFGGLIKKLPITAVIFMIAAISICGLPPLNGFISEWLVYMGLLNSSLTSKGYPILLSAVGVLGIAFAGGLAIICFTKVLGVVFLGELRNEIPSDCHEPSKLLIYPMVVLAAFCILIGLLPMFVWPSVILAVKSISPNLVDVYNNGTVLSLNWISLVFAIIIALSGIFLIIRKIAFSKKEIAETVTWDCGYAKPVASMQYTASSFAEPIAVFFKSILKPTIEMDKISGVFPKSVSFEDHVSDYSERNLFEPLFKKIGLLISLIRKNKNSTIQNYLALIFITLIVLFVLEVWFGI